MLIAAIFASALAEPPNPGHEGGPDPAPLASLPQSRSAHRAVLDLFPDGQIPVESSRTWAYDAGGRRESSTLDGATEHALGWRAQRQS